MDYRVEYLIGKRPAFTSFMGTYGREHTNVTYIIKSEKKDFPDLQSAMEFFNKLAETWETEEKFAKDRIKHISEIKLSEFTEEGWKVIKKADYDEWFNKNKNRWLNNDEDETDEIMETKKTNKKQIRLKESDLSKVIMEAVQEVMQPGSISHGTMNPKDLIPKFMSELFRSNPGKAREIWQQYPNLLQALCDEQAGVPTDWFESEEASEILNNDIFNAMDAESPEGHYFGSHPGDGSDYGYWGNELDEGKKPLKETRLRKIVENMARGVLKEMLDEVNPDLGGSAY